MTEYVHGYSEYETNRLYDQSQTLSDILHHDTIFPPGSHILEAGCGVGAQTVILAPQNPDCFFTSIDISLDSIGKAQELINGSQIKNVEFLQSDIFNLPFPAGHFDHIFVCFVLEHLTQPVKALQNLFKVLKPGGTITVIEGDHGSCFFYPRSEKAYKAWNALVTLQARIGGDSLIGRALYPLLHQAQFQDIHVSPRNVYVDAGKPNLQDGFVRKTIIAMVDGVREEAIRKDLLTEQEWLEGIADLHKTGESPEGTFFYTFFKAIARKM